MSGGAERIGMTEGITDNCDTNVTVPNILTALRIVMATVAAVCFIVRTAEQMAVVLCIVAAVLDAFDGWYARTFSQCSKLGEHLDPLADKLLMAVVYTLIAVKMNSTVVWFLVGLIALREIGMTLFRAYSRSRYKKFIPANRLGKVKMIIQSTVGLAIIAYAYLWNGAFEISVWLVVSPLMIILLLSYYSAIVYIGSWRSPRASGHVGSLAKASPKLDETGRAVVGE